MARKHDKREPRKPMLILTSNEIETQYFNQMRRDCRYANMVVRKKSEQVHTIEQMISEAGTLRKHEGFSESWCITNPSDVAFVPVHADAYEELARKKRVRVVYNNPGIEFWFYLHFTRPAKEFNSRRDVEQALQEYLPGFSSDLEYLTGKEGMQLYMNLFANKSQAALHADAYKRAAGPQRIGEIGHMSTNMPTFLTHVIETCGKCYVARGQMFEKFSI